MSQLEVAANEHGFSEKRKYCLTLCVCWQNYSKYFVTRTITNKAFLYKDMIKV